MIRGGFSRQETQSGIEIEQREAHYNNKKRRKFEGNYIYVVAISGNLRRIQNTYNIHMSAWSWTIITIPITSPCFTTSQ